MNAKRRRDITPMTLGDAMLYARQCLYVAYTESIYPNLETKSKDEMRALVEYCARWFGIYISQTRQEIMPAFYASDEHDGTESEPQILIRGTIMAAIRSIALALEYRPTDEWPVIIGHATSYFNLIMAHTKDSIETDVVFIVERDPHEWGMQPPKGEKPIGPWWIGCLDGWRPGDEPPGRP